jgi:hypothetical protein
MLRENIALQLSKLFQILQNTGTRRCGCLRVGDLNGWISHFYLVNPDPNPVGSRTFWSGLGPDPSFRVPDR